MPRPIPLTPSQLVWIATATGVGWGIVMALIAFVRDGAEIVLLQGWIFGAAWLFGRATREPRAGALAGFAVVAAAIWTYELLPGWGVEAAIRREGVPPAQLEALATAFDRDDIVLLSTMVIGALIGLGGALRPRPAVAAPLPPPPAQVPEAPPPPPPLWAGFERPQPSKELLAPPPPPAPRAPRAERAGTPWGIALLPAGLATDLCLDRIFDLYSPPQGAVAIGFGLLGLLATGWLARRYAIAMVLAGAILASGFAAVQHAEYERRAEPRSGAVR